MGSTLLLSETAKGPLLKRLLLINCANNVGDGTGKSKTETPLPFTIKRSYIKGLSCVLISPLAPSTLPKPVKLNLCPSSCKTIDTKSCLFEGGLPSIPK